MITGGSACGGRTALLRVVDSKVTPGIPSAVASPDLRREGAYGALGMSVLCLDPSKKCSARASSDAGDGRGKTGTCTGIGVASVQGRQGGRMEKGKAVGTVDGDN